MKIPKWIILFLWDLLDFQITVFAYGNRTILFRKKSLAPFSKFATVCYGQLGCFWSGPPFYHPYFRPISVPPLPPELLGTTYYLYTRRNKDAAFVFSALRLEEALVSGFQKSSPTRIVLHGATDGVLLSTWMRDLKDQYLQVADDNVILVDYASKLPLRFLNSANGRVVGAQIGQLIDFIHKHFGASPESFHLIGHSLGAHVAGYAGERVKKLGRITGLDPGGAYYRNVAETVKLDPTDALFVDIIHSGPGRTVLEGFGTIEDIGHVNFWPPVGKTVGCLLTPLRQASTGTTPIELLHNTFFCRHFRSIDFFLFSFNQNGCLFVGAECSSWEEFNLGRCNCGAQGNKCRFMGQFATSAPHETRYYLIVDKDRPYCVHQYQVIMYLELPHLHKAYGSLPLSVDLAVIGDTSFKEKLHFRVNLKERRQIKTFLLTFKEPVGKVLTAAALLHVPQKGHNITVSLEALEINYLFPLPKSEISNLLCKESEAPHGQAKQLLLTPVACPKLIENEI